MSNVNGAGYTKTRHGGHLGFPIGTILAFLSTSHPDASTELQVSWPFGSG